VGVDIVRFVKMGMNVQLQKLLEISLVVKKVLPSLEGRLLSVNGRYLLFTLVSSTSVKATCALKIKQFQIGK
jgi:hypothetical protein